MLSASRNPDHNPNRSTDCSADCSADSLSAVPLTASQQFSEIKISSRGYLPHWETDDAIYFVTYRLADSLPVSVLNQLHAERLQRIKQIENSGRKLTSREKAKITSRFSARLDSYLDRGYGSCILSKPEAAEIVIENLKYFDGVKYRLFTFCVMPNHVHVVFKPLDNQSLERILHSWKSYTGNRINDVLRQEGRLWQPERYDRLIRDEKEFRRIINYVAENPIKAGLENWEWVWCYWDAGELKG